jgi:hypothetical protein
MSIYDSYNRCKTINKRHRCDLYYAATFLYYLKLSGSVMNIDSIQIENNTQIVISGGNPPNTTKNIHIRVNKTDPYSATCTVVNSNNFATFSSLSIERQECFQAYFEFLILEIP